jgi:hypothetical protein
MADNVRSTGYCTDICALGLLSAGAFGVTLASTKGWT